MKCGAEVRMSGGRHLCGQPAVWRLDGRYYCEKHKHRARVDGPFAVMERVGR